MALERLTSFTTRQETLKLNRFSPNRLYFSQTLLFFSFNSNVRMLKASSNATILLTEQKDLKQISSTEFSLFAESE